MSRFSVSFSSPRCTKPICGIASMTRSSSITRSRVKRLGQHRVLRAKRNNGAMCHGPYASFFCLSRAALAASAARTLAAFSGVHGGELCLHLGSLERGLRSSFIVLSIGAGSRSGLSDGSARSIASARSALPRSAVAVAAFSAAALRAWPRQRHGPSWLSRARPSPRA